VSSKPARSIKRLQNSAYFGRTVGSPPGLPGGGITGVLPVSGVGARISGSTPAGGHKTPLDLASLSPSCSPACPVVEPSGVEPSGATVPRGGTGFVGAQSVERCGAGGAVCANGVVGVGGACALAMPGTASKHTNSKDRFIRMQRKRLARAEVPPQSGTTFLRIVGPLYLFV